MDLARRQRIFSLALPIIGGMVSQNLLNIVDTAMVGFLGDAALAAVGLGGFIVFMCQALILGISTGVQSSAARRQGEGNPERAAAILNAALLLVLIVAPIFSLVLIQLAEPAYPYLNADPAVIEKGVPYIEWRLGVPRLLECARPVAPVHENADLHACHEHHSQLCVDLRKGRRARVRRDGRWHGQRHIDGRRHTRLFLSRVPAH
ncbi:MAG: MATE family efflux transporter [Woeseiaceae bacterium]